MIYRSVLILLVAYCVTAFVQRGARPRIASSSLSMAKRLSFREDSRKKLVEGINIVANAVKVQLNDLHLLQHLVDPVHHADLF